MPTTTRNPIATAPGARRSKHPAFQAAAAAGIALLIAACGCSRRDHSTLPFYRGADLTPEWGAEPAASGRRVHRIADFALTDQDGRTVTAQSLEGKIWVANFFYTHCTSICPSMRSNLARVQEACRGDSAVVLLSHTVTPASDSAAVLRAYAGANQVLSGKWHLLTGSAEQITRLARDSYFAKLEGDSSSGWLHSENVVLVDRHRRIRGVYNGTLRFDVERLIEDIATLERENG